MGVMETLQMIKPVGTERLACAYLRRSTDRQEQSIGDQRKAIEQYAEQHDYHVVNWYTDDAISGASAGARNAFLQMISDARKPERPFRWVLVFDIKRFGRLDNDETGYYRHLLAQSGVEVLYASENFAGDDTDDLLRPVKQWQARQELKDLSKVTIRGLLTKSEGGWWMGGIPPYGYDLAYSDRAGKFLMTVRYLPGYAKQVFDEHGNTTRSLDPSDHLTFSKEDRGRLVLSAPERVKIVRRIFQWYTSYGLGFKTIADKLNREGVPSPGRKAGFKGWGMGTIRDILLNPVYTGDMVWNRRTMADLPPEN